MSTSILTKEELAYIDRAYLHFGFFRCRAVPVERLITIGKRLSQGRETVLSIREEIRKVRGR